MSRKITCTNNNGSTMTFDTEGFKPFVLAKVDGLYQSTNSIFTTDNTMTDGAVYQGSVAKKRNVVLTLIDAPNNVFNQTNRDALYVLFAKDSTGTLKYEENGNVRVIDYVVEKVYKGTLNSRVITVSLICTDPFFYDKDNTIVQLANWVGDFEFIHEFSEDGEDLGHREPTRIANITNDTAIKELGMTILIEASSVVLNPKVVRVQDNTKIQIGSENYPFSTQANDVIMITTSVNDKHVYLIRDGVTTEINEYLTEDSKFLQIERGINTYGFDADSGVDYMTLTIQYKRKYEGA